MKFDRSVPNEEKNPWVAEFEAAMSCGVGTFTMLVAELRTRSHSVLWKKKSLSFFTGPPME